MEFHRFAFLKAQCNIQGRAEMKNLRESAEWASQNSIEEAEKYTSLSNQQTHLRSQLANLQQEKTALETSLEAKTREIAEAQSQLEALSEEVKTQAAVAEKATNASQAAWDAVPDEISDDSQDY